MSFYLCKTCGVRDGTHACNPKDIVNNNLRNTIAQLQLDNQKLRDALKSVKKSVWIAVDTSVDILIAQALRETK